MSNHSVSVDVMNLTDDAKGASAYDVGSPIGDVQEILDAMAWQCSDDYWDERTSKWWPCRGPCDSKCPVTTEVVPIGRSCGCACPPGAKRGARDYRKTWCPLLS